MDRAVEPERSGAGARAALRGGLALGLLAALAGASAWHQHAVVRSVKPAVLRIGVLPDQARESLEAIYPPLARYLGDALSVPTALVIPDSYDDLLERFHRGELDLALFGGATFVQAEQRDGAVPLVVRIVDLHFTSVVIARAGLAGRFPDDFEGRSFAFSSRRSTSGHRMPRYFFERMGLVPERHFAAVVYLATHDDVIAAVESGRVDVGVLAAPVLRQRMAAGACDPRRVRAVWESPPFADYVWAAPPRLPPALRDAIRDAFLELEPGNPEHDRIMEPLRARTYVPATRAEFDLVRRVVTGDATYSAHAR